MKFWRVNDKTLNALLKGQQEIGKEVYEISEKVFDEETESKKIDLPNPARMTGWRDIDIWASGFNKCLELVMKLNDQPTNRGGE